MPIKTRSVLQGQSILIRDETIDYANTTTRVGSHLLDTVDSLALAKTGSGITYNSVDDRFDWGGALLASSVINSTGYGVSFSGGSFIAENSNFKIDLNTGLVLSDLRVTKVGMEYAADYSSSYGDRSIPDWKAVKNYSDAKQYTFTGLTDTDFTGLVTGKTIQYNGSKWVPVDFPSGGGGSLWAADGSNIFYQAGNVEIRDGKSFKIFDSGTTDSWSFSVDGNNNLIVSGPANANTHFSGDVVAFSDLTPPAGTWWDSMPIAGASSLGGIKVGSGLSIDGLGVLSASGGVTDHGALTGLADDDHTQYYNQTRGDARYSLTTHLHTGVYAPVSHTHTESQITDLNKFWVLSGSNIYYNTGNVGIGLTSPGVALDVSGSIRATGEITAYYSSDERLKENIKSLDIIAETNKIKQLRPVNYYHKEHKAYESGLIAQELQNVYPDIVKKGHEDYLYVDYIRLVPSLIATVQNLEKRIRQLEKRLNG